MQDLNTSPETKAYPVPNDNLAQDSFMRAFESFKEGNDKRLSDIEKRKADPLNEEKVDKLNLQLDRLLKANEAKSLSSLRPPLHSARAQPSEEKAAFNSFMRQGGAGELETRAMSNSIMADGGFTSPAEVESTINRVLSSYSPLRSICGIREISTASYKRPFISTGFQSGWVGETAPRPATANTPIEEQLFQAFELYAMPAATQALLDDNVVDLENWLANEVYTVFAEQETQAFVNGNGLTSPKGFVTYTSAPAATALPTQMGYIASGAAGAFAASNPSDKLQDLTYALKGEYRQNATFVMNRKTQAEVRKLKSTTGEYLWKPPVVSGAQASLFGLPLLEIEAMPDIAANSMSIAFGDFKRGYLIVDRMGMRILRDPYSNKPYVMFYVTKRVGGGVSDMSAIKLMKFSAA